MSRAWVVPARAFSVLVSMIMLMFTLGIATPASADPPEDRGNHSSSNSNGNSAEAHEKNADRKSESTSSTSSSSATTGGDVTASGQGSSKTKATKSNRGGKKKVSASTASSHQTSTKNGTFTEAQPESTADKNDGGANAGDCPGEPYCSTRDGSPSMNGNGGGNAKGKPCAGCVGKADNKNPPGQVKEWNAANGHIRDFGNKGYECDDNNGIGKTNPAHTGCESTPPTVVDDCPKDDPYYENGCVPPTTSEDCPPTHKYFENGCEPPSPQCPDGSDVPCDEDEECIGSEANDFCEETPPGTDDENPPTVIAGVQDFANPRPPTVAGVEAFAGAPQAGVLPATGASSTAGWFTTLGVALLLMGGAVIGLRRQNLVRAKR